jgi:hypothetical protein
MITSTERTTTELLKAQEIIRSEMDIEAPSSPRTPNEDDDANTKSRKSSSLRNQAWQAGSLRARKLGVCGAFAGNIREMFEYEDDDSICKVMTAQAQTYLLKMTVMLAIVGAISAAVGRAFVEQQVLQQSFPDGVFDLGSAIGWFIAIGLVWGVLGMVCAILVVVSIVITGNESFPDQVDVCGDTTRYYAFLLVVVAGVGSLVLPPLGAAAVVAQVFNLKFNGVFVFMLVAHVIEMLTKKSNKKSSTSEDGDSGGNTNYVFEAAWRALGSCVAYAAATGGGVLPAVANGLGLAAVLGSVAGTALVPVFMAFQLDAQEILGQDTGNSTVSMFT